MYQYVTARLSDSVYSPWLGFMQPFALLLRHQAHYARVSVPICACCVRTGPYENPSAVRICASSAPVRKGRCRADLRQQRDRTESPVPCGSAPAWSCGFVLRRRWLCCADLCNTLAALRMVHGVVQRAVHWATCLKPGRLPSMDLTVPVACYVT